MKVASIYAEYRDHMGGDLMVVNAARTSFGKESDWHEPPSRAFPGGRLSAGDESLVRFLALGYRTKEWNELAEIVAMEVDHEEVKRVLRRFKKAAQHWAPFGHPHLQIRMKLPLFLARQFVKHQVGGVWSEESRRYMSSEPEFWFPAQWQKRPEDIKQGASGLADGQDELFELSYEHTQACLDVYNEFLRRGVAPEEARLHLPLNTMTTVTWTGSLLFWSRVANQRLDGHAQHAAQVLAQYLSDIAQPLFPVSWRELVEN